MEEKNGIKKVLIIEDEPAIAGALKEKIGSGHGTIEVSLAANGEEGITAALAQKPGLILLDILMPKMNGLEVLKRLRDDAWGHRVPIIIFTNVEADDAVMAQIAMYEPSYYFVKSDWKIGDIVDKARELLKI